MPAPRPRRATSSRPLPNRRRRAKRRLLPHSRRTGRWMAERLQKFLARAGIASRRHAEQLISQGRVQVNNRTVVELGTKVEPSSDLVTVDGKLVELSTR